MTTKTYTVYKYDECPEELKQSILERYCEINVDYDWWDSTYDWFVNLCEHVGVTIDQKVAGKRKNGEAIYEPAIYFDIDRGAHASFQSSVSVYRMLKGVRGKTWRKDSPTLDFAFTKFDVNKAILRNIKDGRIDVACRTTTYHHGGMSTELEWDASGIEEGAQSLLKPFIEHEMEKLEACIKAQVEGMSRWLLDTLRKDYRYLTSRKGVEEALIDGDYDFNEEGEIDR